MKAAFTSLAALLLAPLAGLTAAEPARPNIVIILLDDLGSADLGCQGSKDLATPNMDRLATSGVRFTQAYANGSFCTPTRAALMGGRYQQRFGVEALAGADARNTLPPQVRTLPERLRDAGYRTCFVGKWHVGDRQEGCRPEQQGFDETPVPKGNAKEDRAISQGRLAADFIERSKDGVKPFFLYLAFNAPHVPVNASERYVQRFAHIQDERRRMYAAMVSTADESVGMVVRELEKSGKLANTLILCSSDNGGPTTRNGVNGSSNAPLRGSKCETFEGGIRVPLLAQWPAVLPAGKTFASPVISFDMSATALAAAGADAAQTDGADLTPYLLGAKTGAPHEALFWRSRTMDNNYAVRQGNWKFVHSTSHQLSEDGTDRTYAKDPPSKKQPAREMLFDLVTDPHEEHDIAAKQPGKMDELKTLFQRWSDEVDADSRALGVEPQNAKDQ